MNSEIFLQKVFEERGFKADEGIVRRVLWTMLEEQPLDLWDIYTISDEYFESVIDIVETMRKNGMASIDDQGRYSLTEQGFDLAKKLEIGKLPQEHKSRIDLPIPKGMEEILKMIKKIYEKIDPKTEFEQGSLNPDASIRKIVFAINKGDVQNKDIVCIGDDDLLSVVMGLTGLPKSITVIDIDQDILDLIKQNFEELDIKIPLKTLTHDLAKPLPQELTRKFDVFMTQPPDTVLGFTLFVSRGVELLKKKPGMIGYAGLTTIGCPIDGLLEIQRIFTQMGLLITDDLNKFLEYLPGETEIKKVEIPGHTPFPAVKSWYVSDLIRVRTTSTTKHLYGNIENNIADYHADATKYLRK